MALPKESTASHGLKRQQIWLEELKTLSSRVLWSVSANENSKPNEALSHWQRIEANSLLIHKAFSLLPLIFSDSASKVAGEKAVWEYVEKEKVRSSADGCLWSNVCQLSAFFPIFSTLSSLFSEVSPQPASLTHFLSEPTLTNFSIFFPISQHHSPGRQFLKAS